MLCDKSTMGTFFQDATVTSLQLVLGAMTFVVALAWNEAFKSWLQENPKLRMFGPWVYAVSVTAIMVGAAMALSNVQSTLKEAGGENILN